MKKLIAITALRGSGKDTTADYIVKNYLNWEKDSFAGTLKDAVSAIFGLDRKMLAGETAEDRAIREKPDEYWSEKLGYEVTPRMLLQKIGTDILRDYFDKNIWINSLEHKLMNTDKNVIVTDCRFKNEIDVLKELGAIFIRIQRPPLPKWFEKVEEIGKLYYKGARFLVDPYQQIDELQNIHQSEWDWIGYDRPDYVLKNNGTFEDLYTQIRQIKELNDE